MYEGLKFSCNDCGFKATTKHDLDIHIQTAHEGIKFPCNLCSFKASQKQHLIKHIKIDH